MEVKAVTGKTRTALKRGLGTEAVLKTRKVRLDFKEQECQR